MENDGTTRHLVDPVSERFGSRIGPKIMTRRVSHVESWDDLSEETKVRIQEQRWWAKAWPELCEQLDHNWFWADLAPVDGPVLGPFSKYEEAIAAEIQWLQQNNLPAPQG